MTEGTAGNPITEQVAIDENKPATVPFTITILGAGSATPMLDRYPTAQLLNYQNEHFLIDCGEGTQLRLLAQRARPGRLKYIFISHLHGDHYFGLAPLLSSLTLSSRKEDLYLFGPQGLDEILTTMFRVSDMRLCYRLHFQAIDPHKATVLVDLPYLTITSIPLQHRIACTGFLFQEKDRPRRLLRHKLPDEVPVEVMRQLKEGHDIMDDQGQVLYAVEDYTTPGPKARSYAYCSDTRFNEPMVPLIKGVDLLYHEATFLDDNLARAEEVYHSTARQAGEIAAQAGVGHLLIGHFSSRYKEFQPFIDEARAAFPNTTLAIEGQTIELPD